MEKRSGLPTVSIVIPVYNRENLIKDCLSSLINLDYPKEKLEIIVVDNGSTDGSPEIVKRFRNSETNIKLLFTKRKGSASARRLAISHATGEIIAFTDSDCRVDKEWVKELVKNFQDQKVGIVAGRTQYYGPKNYISKVLERKGFKITYFYALRKKLKLQFAPTCNLAVKREVLKIIGEYGENFSHGGDDIDLGVKIKTSGYEIALAKGALVYHTRETRRNLLSTIKTIISYGKADFILQLKYPSRRKLTFPPPLFIFFYLLLFTAIIAPFSSLHYLLLPFSYLLLYILFDYSLIFFTRCKNLYEYTAGSAVNYNPIEYIVSFLIRCAFDLGIFLKKITRFELSSTYFIVDDRTLHNLERNKKKEILVNLLNFVTILISLKWLRF